MALCEKVQSGFVDDFGKDEDRVILGAAANGKFSTKSCYNLLRPGDISPTDTQQWDAIWHLKGPYTLRHFICFSNFLFRSQPLAATNASSAVSA